MVGAPAAVANAVAEALPPGSASRSRCRSPRSGFTRYLARTAELVAEPLDLAGEQRHVPDVVRQLTIAGRSEKPLGSMPPVASTDPSRARRCWICRFSSSSCSPSGAPAAGSGSSTHVATGAVSSSRGESSTSAPSSARRRSSG